MQVEDVSLEMRLKSSESLQECLDFQLLKH